MLYTVYTQAHAHMHTFFRERNFRQYPRMIGCKILCRLNLEINPFRRSDKIIWFPLGQAAFVLLNRLVSSQLFLLPSFPFPPISFVPNGNPVL